MSSTKKILLDLKSKKITRAQAEKLILSLRVGQSVANKNTQVDGIAIIGQSGRYPKSDNLNLYWENLKQGNYCVQRMPASRWDSQPYLDDVPVAEGKIYSDWIGMVDDVAGFDADFFKIPPSEAEMIDPQQRIFLQEAYRAFEDAGYSRDALSGTRCGVYLGIMSNEYAMMLAQSSAKASSVAGNSFSIAASRISYFLNLQGPAVPVDTACSSSLVALYQACLALKHRDIDSALVGGVTLYLAPESYIAMCAAGMLSPEGKCKTFDASADGFVPGEGVGAVVLKRLDDAVRDRDNIIGIVEASGVNQDGKTNGISAPSGISQTKLIEKLYRDNNIKPENISYCEAHGTGTKLGDPVELNALTEVFHQSEDGKPYCAIGSVKSNIGHASAAAGVASIHKVLLSMKHATLVPSLFFNSPNEHYDFDRSPFYVNTKLSPWQAPKGQARRAAISSFGLSGTNSHVVITEYIQEELDTPEADEEQLIILSAQTELQLQQQAEQLLNFVDKNPKISLKNTAFTLQVGREQLKFRLAIPISSFADLKGELLRYLKKSEVQYAFTGEVNTRSTKTFSADNTMSEEAIAICFERKDWKTLAKTWVDGTGVDWISLRKRINDKCQRISLPTYPFAKKQYWAPELKQEDAEASLVFMEKRWRISPEERKNVGVENPFILCLAGEDTPLANALVEYFPSATVGNIKSVANIDLNSHTSFIDLTGCGVNQAIGREWFEFSQRLIGLKNVDALGVTVGLESSQSKVTSGAMQAAFYRNVGAEYAAVTGRHLDIDAQLDIKMQAEQIFCEVNFKAEATEYIYRGNERYQSELVALKDLSAILDSSDDNYRSDDNYSSSSPKYNTPQYNFKPDDVLWVTGGTRGIGYTIAKHMVKNYAVKTLFLTAKNNIPDRSSWAKIKLTDDSQADKIRNIEALESLGARVIITTSPLADDVALFQELNTLEKDYGVVKGIVHCAGISNWDNPAHLNKSWAECNAVFSPKVAAVNNIGKFVENRDVNFVVLFSSVSAVIPTLASGQLDYAMANAYMDYFANGSKLPIISLQWPNWIESGMGHVKSQAYRDSGLLGLRDRDGLALFDRALTILQDTDKKILMPTRIDTSTWEGDKLLHALRTRTRNQKKPVLLDAHSPSESGEGGGELSALEGWLLSIFSEKLKIDRQKIEVDVHFQEYGVDSILLVQLMRPLNDLAEHPLDPSLLFEYSSIAKLSEWLLEHEYSLVKKALEDNKDAVDRMKVPRASLATRVKTPPQKSLSKNIPENKKSNSDIAVVGMSCCFPKAPSLEKFWKMISQGGNAIAPIPDTRWHTKEKSYAAMLNEDIELDTDFFTISESDLAVMDPQLKLLLQGCKDLFSHSGYNHQELKGKNIGVYVGGRSRHNPDKGLLDAADNPIVAVGQNYLAASISKHFDLRGQSMVIDTACSSALSAMNIAVQAINNGDIDSAIVAGVSWLDNADGHQLFEKRGLLAKDKQFHVFDRRASGVVLGEGVGMVMLKSCEKALADEDQIYALIKGIAINNDGKTAGPASPNIGAHKEVIAKALKKSGKSPEDITHIEAHGSGSEITDLIELKSLNAIYRGSSQSECSLGSIKPNIGHPLCAEGIASFIKVTLMLHHRSLVPFISGDQKMNHYSINDSPFYFERQCRQWTGAAAINCFADGGTNAHLVLEGYTDNLRAISFDNMITNQVVNRVNFWNLDIREN